jgi:molecular chaperone GrpE
MARPLPHHPPHKPAATGAGTSEPTVAENVHTAEEVNLLRETIIRQRAEFDNFRKRTQREKDQVREMATEGLLSHLLPVLDNMERALTSAESAVDVKSVRDGVSMIAIQLRRTLENEGLEQVKALHEQFDPAFHDALAAEQRDDVPDGQVCEVLLPGYVYKQKLLRPAMVKVARRPQG